MADGMHDRDPSAPIPHDYPRGEPLAMPHATHGVTAPRHFLRGRGRAVRPMWTWHPSQIEQGSHATRNRTEPRPVPPADWHQCSGRGNAGRGAPCCRCSPARSSTSPDMPLHWTFVLAFGLVKAGTHLAAGAFSDRVGRQTRAGGRLDSRAPGPADADDRPQFGAGWVPLPPPPEWWWRGG